MYGKTFYIEKKFGFKNQLDGKTTCIEKLLGLK
jgi:hypothetical protein